jgi:hypothetical protein
MLFAGIVLLALPGAARPASFGDVVINEINWAGDQGSSSHEWVELYNTTRSAVSLHGWCLLETNTADSGDSAVQSFSFPSLTLGAGSYLVILGNSGDAGISLPPGALSHAIPNFSGGLRNSGEQLILRDDAGNTIDLANLPLTAWFAGTNLPDRRSMERVYASWSTAADGTLAGSWSTYGGLSGTGTPGLRRGSGSKGS